MFGVSWGDIVNDEVYEEGESSDAEIENVN
jgi:hypothetical protein